MSTASPLAPLAWSDCPHCHRPGALLMFRHGARRAWAVCLLHSHTDAFSYVIGRRIDATAGDVNA